MLQTYKKPFIPVIVGLGKQFEKRRFTDPPVFIGGCARSGTTILFSILSAHKNIYCFHKELGVFNKVKRDAAGNASPTRADRLYTAMMKHHVPREAKCWCEKSPSNIRRIDDIENYYRGRFKFIHIIRDGRDVILSRHPKDKDSYWVPPERWINDVSTGLSYIDHKNVHTLRYEALIIDFEHTISGICKFLNIPVSEEILNWHEYATLRENKAYFTEVKQLTNSSIGKWKRKENEARVKELTDNPDGMKLLKQLGYD